MCQVTLTSAHLDLCYHLLMKYLCIDYGTKRVGLALSDESGTLARPFAVIVNDKKLIAEIAGIVSKEGIESIVVGYSQSNAGGDNKVNETIQDFVASLTLETMLPIEMMNEAFTSYEAHGRKGKESLDARKTKAPAKPADLDARAAAIILERYLEKKKK